MGESLDNVLQPLRKTSTEDPEVCFWKGYCGYVMRECPGLVILRGEILKSDACLPGGGGQCSETREGGIFLPWSHQHVVVFWSNWKYSDIWSHQ